jgi:hypothetical protein
MSDELRVTYDPDYSGHGKFNSNVDEWLYTKALEGWGTESFGEADYGGHYELIEFSAEEPLEVERGPDIEAHQAVVLVTDSRGFVVVIYYDDIGGARAAWSEAMEQWGASR